MSMSRVLSVCLCVVLGISLSAQERRASGPPYDPSGEVTVSGVADGIETFAVPDGQVISLLNVTVEGKPLVIILGPQRWFSEQRFSVEKGTAVQVTGLTGRRVNSKPAMLPRLVKAGSRTLTVRNEKGLPVWEAGGVAAIVDATVHQAPPAAAPPSSRPFPQPR